MDMVTKKLIMVVEDNGLNREMLVGILEYWMRRTDRKH